MSKMTVEEYLDEGTRAYDPHPEARKFFANISQPSMTELVNWFQTEFIDLARAMKDSDHASEDGQPNAYHVEGTVWAHTMMVCSQARYDNTVVKLCALLHDVGKPTAREVIPINAPKPSMNGEERASTVELKAGDRTHKTHFRGHEGMSFWIALDVLVELKRLGVISAHEVEEIVTIISLHGTLFNRIKDGREYKPEQVVGMFDSFEMYANFIKQSRNDSLGRFYEGEGSRANHSGFLGKELYGSAIWMTHAVSHHPKPFPDEPTVNVLVGLPCAGKSTEIAKLKKANPEIVVISKDDVIMEMGEVLGHTSYTDVYKKLTDAEHKEAYSETIRRFQEAVKDRKDIVIDMTNMSKKSRNKWASNLKKYNKKATVFLAGQSLLFTRNLLRSQNDGKFIPAGVYSNMMKTFMVPTLYEFDEVAFVHQDEG